MVAVGTRLISGAVLSLKTYNWRDLMIKQADNYTSGSRTLDRGRNTSRLTLRDFSFLGDPRSDN